MCVKLLYVKFIVVYVRKREEEAGGGEGARDTESKTRTPHKDVGKNKVVSPLVAFSLKPSLGSWMGQQKMLCSTWPIIWAMPPSSVATKVDLSTLMVSHASSWGKWSPNWRKVA